MNMCDIIMKSFFWLHFVRLSTDKVNKYSGNPPNGHLGNAVTPLLRSPVNTADGHILKTQTVEFLATSPR